MRIRFHQSLDELKERLLVMAGMAEQAIQRAIQLDPADARNRAISETIVPRTVDKG